MRPSVSIPLALSLTLVLTGCGAVEESAADAGSPGGGKRRDAPSLSSALKSGCYGWPGSDFGPGNNTGKFEPGLAEGALAVDFTLPAIDGAAHTLSQLLRDKPVFLQTGSWTCPIYQDNLSPTNALAGRTTPRGDTYGDAVHFVHAYVLEAHPAAPDNSPYRGEVWEQETSDRGQALTPERRLSDARDMAKKVSGRQLMLVDAVAPDGANPVWCTYGPCPNCAYLIDQDGTIVTVQKWLDVEGMAEAIEGLLARSE